MGGEKAPLQMTAFAARNPCGTPVLVETLGVIYPVQLIECEPVGGVVDRDAQGVGEARGSDQGELHPQDTGVSQAGGDVP